MDFGVKAVRHEGKQCTDLEKRRGVLKTLGVLVLRCERPHCLTRFKVGFFKVIDFDLFMVGMLHYRFNYVGLTCMDDFVVVGLERVVYDQIFCGLVLLQRETVRLY